jgi:hypothetical protein
LFLLACSSGFCVAQVITVRVINEKNGRALPREEISVSFFFRTGESVPQGNDSKQYLIRDANLNFHAKTDANGVAQITLPQPAPLQLWVGAGLPSQYWFCSCATQAFVSTEFVMEKGIVQRLHPKSTKIPEALPGQIIFVARPYNLFERLMAPLLKE